MSKSKTLEVSGPHQEAQECSTEALAGGGGLHAQPSDLMMLGTAQEWPRGRGSGLGDRKSVV